MSMSMSCKVVDIKRMTKNPNPGLFIFLFFFFFCCCFCEVRGEGGAEIGRARGGVGKGAIIFICDPLYKPNTHCFTNFMKIFHRAIELACPLPKNSLRKSSEGCYSKHMGEITHRFLEDFSRTISTKFC